MQHKKPLLLILLAVLIGCIAYFAFTAQIPPAFPAKPEKSAREAKPPLGRLLGEIEFPADQPAQTSRKKIPLEKFWMRYFGETNRPTLSAAQLKRHIETRGHSAASLLAALHISGNLDYLREAYDRYPANPDVLMELALLSESPEERLEAIQAIRKIDPDWGLPNYLLALEQAKAGDREAAMLTFLAAGSSKFVDYSSVQKWEGIEQAYLDNGFAPHEAKFIGLMTAPAPDLMSLLKMSKEMTSLQTDFLKKGDTSSALQLAQAARALNQKKQAESFETLEIVTGNGIETSFLKNLPPATELGSGLTAGQRLADLRTKNEQIREAISIKTFLQMNEQELSDFVESAKIHGELEATLRWNAKGR